MDSCDIPTGPGGTAMQLLALAIPDAASEAMGSWVLGAACAGADPAIFFPGSGGHDTEAKRMCARCTVWEECREYSLRTGPHWGVWGGLDEKERKALARRRKRQRARAGKGLADIGGVA
jgi:WhiB family transcriptional regulator, redox-sensing transcriptional regulator